jgi:hypothetical protein
MAEFDSVSDVSKTKEKDKEVSSQNVASIFAKLNWRHLVGLESIAICLQSQSVLKNLRESPSVFEAL